MQGRGAFVRVGALVLGRALLLVGLVWFLGGRHIRNGTLFETYFRESVQGLEVGAPVKYRGVTIGRVTEIGLVAAEYSPGPTVPLDRQIYRLVLVRALVDTKKIAQLPDTEDAVALGLRARLSSTGLTGVAYIEMDFVNPRRYPAEDVPWKPTAEYIPSIPSTLTQVQDAAQQFLSRLDQVDLVRLSDTMTTLLASLQSSLADGDAHTVLVRLATLLQTADETIKAADVGALSADLRRTSAAMRALAEDRDLRRTLANAAVASDRLAAASAQLPELLGSIRSTTRRADHGVADVQAAIGPLLRDLQASAANLRELTEALRRNPAQLVTGQPPPRPAERGR
mgnify:FL=1